MTAPRPRILAAYLGCEIDELLPLDGLPAEGHVTAHLATSPTPGSAPVHHLLRPRAVREGSGVRVTLGARELQRGVEAAGASPGLYYLVVAVPGRYHAACRIRLHAARVM